MVLKHSVQPPLPFPNIALPQRCPSPTLPFPSQLLSVGNNLLANLECVMYLRSFRELQARISVPLASPSRRVSPPSHLYAPLYPPPLHLYASHLYGDAPEMCHPASLLAESCWRWQAVNFVGNPFCQEVSPIA